MNTFKHLVFGTTSSQEGNMALHTGDSSLSVLNNRRRLSKSLGIDLNSWTLAHQTHSTTIVKIDSSMVGRGSHSNCDAIPECDCLYTKESDVLLGVFSADCLGILIYDQSQDLLCALHSGWKGSVQEYVSKVIQYLVENEQCIAKSMHVYIGPSIHQKNFEIKEDILDLLNNMSFDTSSYISYTKDRRMFADMIGINVHMIQSAGVPIDQIQVSPIDTYEHGFSYRKNKTVNRHLTYILKRSV